MAALTFVVLLILVDTLWGHPAYQGMHVHRYTCMQYGLYLKLSLISLAPLILGTPRDVIAGEYIVVLNSKLSLAKGTLSLHQLTNDIYTLSFASRALFLIVTSHVEYASALIAQDGSGSALIDVYSIGDFKGYAAKLSDKYVQTLMHHISFRGLARSIDLTPPE